MISKDASSDELAVLEVIHFRRKPQLYKWLHAMVEFEHKISKTKIKQVKDK